MIQPRSITVLGLWSERSAAALEHGFNNAVSFHYIHAISPAPSTWLRSWRAWRVARAIEPRTPDYIAWDDFPPNESLDDLPLALAAYEHSDPA